MIKLREVSPFANSCEPQLNLTNRKSDTIMRRLNVCRRRSAAERRAGVNRFPFRANGAARADFCLFPEVHRFSTGCCATHKTLTEFGNKERSLQRRQPITKAFQRCAAFEQISKSNSLLWMPPLCRKNALTPAFLPPGLELPLFHYCEQSLAMCSFFAGYPDAKQPNRFFLEYQKIASTS